MIPVKEICFPSDTAERKRLFKAASFAHPAKMHLSLQIYLIEHYTKNGDTILDPMGGSGTLLVACALGRNVIAVELEGKFVKMMEANWDKIKSLGPMLGYKLGRATILQGDARCLDGLLVDSCIFSPPFGSATAEIEQKFYAEGRKRHKRSPNCQHFGTEKYGKTKGQIGNLPYGEISAVISSPPFQEAEIKRKGQEESRKNYNYGNKLKMSSEHPDNISKLAENNYGNIDVVCTSPPYEGSEVGKGIRPNRWDKVKNNKGFKGRKEWQTGTPSHYSDAQDNIGNLKSENYLEAMLAVYQGCHRVLKEGGLMLLVVKNFIRNKEIVRLDTDTIKLCETAGFALKERMKRKLTQKSFWRILYERKYPTTPKIEHEDILVFKKTGA